MPAADNTLETELLGFLDRYNLKKKSFLIAYSGGLDSTVLLHLFSKVVPTEQLSAMYIDHQLHPDSAQWGVFCEHQSQALGIPCEVKQVTVVESASMEQAAREARYIALNSQLGDKILVTAHHQADQVETVLFNLIRGAGINGLSGMSEYKKISDDKKSDAYHIRPFLGVSKKDLLSYAQENNLNWIEDPSNQDTDFDRNFLRNDIIPKLKAHWPNIENNISRSAEHLKRQGDWNRLHWAQFLNANNSQCLAISVLKDRSLFEQQQILRAWFQDNMVRYPNQDRLNELIATLPNNSDQNWKIEWPSYSNRISVRCYRDTLYLVNEDHLAGKIEKAENFEWNPSETHPIPGFDIILNKEILDSNQIDLDVNRSCQVCFGIKSMQEKLYLKGSKQSKSMKNFFQEKAVPPWLRSNCALIYQDERLKGIIVLQKFN